MNTEKKTHEKFFVIISNVFIRSILSLYFHLFLFKDMYIKHQFLAPGVRHLEGVLESLPTYLQDDEVMIACYAREGDDIVVIGYYKINGFYEGNIARPDGFKGDISASNSQYTQKARQVYKRDDCWAGGDTGGFYYYTAK